MKSQNFLSSTNGVDWFTIHGLISLEHLPVLTTVVIFYDNYVSSTSRWPIAILKASSVHVHMCIQIIYKPWNLYTWMWLSFTVRIYSPLPNIKTNINFGAYPSSPEVYNDNYVHVHTKV
jgi:hypothetical protein